MEQAIIRLTTADCWGVYDRELLEGSGRGFAELDEAAGRFEAGPFELEAPARRCLSPGFSSVVSISLSNALAAGEDASSVLEMSSRLPSLWVVDFCPTL